MGNSKKMKILMISEFYDLSGVVAYINNLSKALREKGHEVYCLYLYPKEAPEERFVKFIDYRPRNRFQWFFSENLFSLKLYKRIRKHILSINPDIVHFHNIYKATKTVLLACRGFKKVQTVHDFGIVCPLCTFKKDQFEYLCDGKMGFKCFKNSGFKLRTYLLDYLLFNSSIFKKRSIKYFICPSAKLTKAVDRAGFKKAVYLPHLYNFTSQMKYRDSNNVLFIGRLEKEKGINYLLEAFGLVKKGGDKKLRLNIVGDGSEAQNLKDFARELKIDKFVNFIGSVNNNQVGRLYEDSFVVVIPSICMEQFGMVGLEAMSYGIPVIASNIGGIPDWLEDGKNGFLVERFDISSMAEKIILLSNNKKLAKKMGERGRALGREKFNPQNHLKKITQLYRKTMNEH